MSNSFHHREDLPAHLDPSPLGTKEYWTTLYTSDLATRSSIPSYTGTSWFDDADAERKTVQFLNSLARQPANGSTTDPQSSNSIAPPSPPSLDITTTSFLDLGTGNGSQLFALRRAGWAGRTVGVDYTLESMQLAERIWAEMIKQQQGEGEHREDVKKEGKGEESGGSEEDEEDTDDGDKDKDADSQPSWAPIDFHTYDIFSSLSGPASQYPDWLPSSSSGSIGFDVVLDKGTFDAISLSAETDSSGRRPCERYAEAVKPLVRKSGLLLVTSCNWTEQELERWICGAAHGHDEDNDNNFEVCGRVLYPRFKFGGVEGQSVVGVAFRRR